MKSNQFKMLKTLGLLLAAGVISNQAVAADSADATVSAEIVQAIAITNTAGLNFGKAVAPATGTATLVVDAAGDRTGTATKIASSPTAAAFSVVGGTGLAYTATATYTAAIGTGLTLSALTASCGGQTKQSLSDSGASGGSISCTNATGTDALTLGGTLTLATDAATLTNGTITVTVAYN